MVYWHWLIIGFALAAAEMITPGIFYFLFLGISAILVGVVLSIGIPIPTWGQILIFSVLAIIELVIFRGPIQRKLALGSSFSKEQSNFPVEMIGERGVVTQEIQPDAVGQIELRGSPWTARSASGNKLLVGEECFVERIDGLTLWVKSK